MAVKNCSVIRPILWLLLLSLYYGPILYAQSYIADIRKISIEHGLSSRFVKAIHKDSQGFIWISTSHGLSRFVCYTFTNFTQENSGLALNIIAIEEDQNQQLWLLSNSASPLMSIDILELQTGKIRTFDQAFKDRAPFTVKDIKAIKKSDADIKGIMYFDTDKNVWFLTQNNEVYRYNNKTFDLIFTGAEKEIRRILHADNRFLWLQGEELLKVELQTGAVQKYHTEERINIIGRDGDKNFWIFQPEERKLLCASCSENALDTIDLESLNFPEEMYEPGFSHYEKWYINPDDNLLWWYHKKEGTNYFLVFHPRQGIVMDLQPKIAPFQTYGSLTINNRYFDTDNRVWIATNDGFFIITLKKNKFTTLLSDRSSVYSARGIVEDNMGNIYINTYSGRVLIDPGNGITKRYANDGMWVGVFRDEQGNLWFGGQGTNVEKYNPLTGERQLYLKDAKDNAPWAQWSIIRDKSGCVWSATQKGLYYLDPQTGSYGKFNRYNGYTKLGESAVYHMQEDEEGIWIVSSSGLYLLEPGKGISLRYGEEEQPPYRIPHNHILHFHRDTEGIFWMATKNEGLIRFDPATGHSRQFTTKEGLSNNTLYAVYEDDYGKLWLPSNYGLMQFDKKTYRVNTYLTGDGIAHNEFNMTSHYRDTKGRLYFGGLAGVTVFHPEDFAVKDAIAVPLQLTRCQVLNGNTGELTDRTKAVLDSKKLVLTPSDRSFIIAFALLNYDNSSQNSYAYKIEGLDKAWTNIEGNTLRINAMPYGRYVLHIKGRGIKGEWSANEISITVLVKKPFYLENGFIVACIIALGMLIYGIFRWRLSNLKQAKIKLQETVSLRTQEIQRQKDKIEKDKYTIEQQAEKLQELNTTQSRWFTNIAHELRTPLTLILGPIRQFLKTHPKASQNGIESIQLAEKNSQNLLKLVNEILDISRLESNSLKIDPNPTDLTQLIRESVAHFDSFARQKGVTLTTDIHSHINLNIDKDRIQKILINLISNALKFTHNGGSVNVSVHYETDNPVKISVADTGDGIPEKDLPHIFKRYYQASHPGQMHQGGTGIGLALSLELARLHNGNLSVESREGKGSVFTLSLPYSLVTAVERSTSKTAAIAAPSGHADIVLKPPVRIADNDKNKPSILLVEDNPDMRKYIKSFMTDHYTITEAADGIEALELLEKTTPELIISDIMMPRMDGITLAKTLKDDARFKSIPFITLTARADESSKISTLRIGIDDYLTKPFNPEELQVRAANLIHNYTERKSVSQPDPIMAPAYQDKVVAGMKDLVMERLEDSSFSVNVLADAKNMSLSSLKRFLKKTTGLSPGQFIREIRLQQARKLLEAKQYSTVLEVVYAVGFENASHFAKLFSERFGKKPSEYL